MHSDQAPDAAMPASFQHARSTQPHQTPAEVPTVATGHLHHRQACLHGQHADTCSHCISDSAKQAISEDGSVGSKYAKAATAASADVDAVVVDISSGNSDGMRQGGTKSIFDVYSKRRKGIILATVSLATVLVPLCDTVYLPALGPIQHELNTSQTLVSASVAVYMFTVGLSSLFWGPASDRFGRRRIYLASTAMFLATTLVCIFAPSIGVLVAFRALQGAAVAAYATAASGTIADVYAPHERGQAMGIATIPVLVGPILGPILGGALSQQWGWRATFIAVIMFSGVIILPLLLFGLPETHHYRNLRRIHKKDPAAAAEVNERDIIFDTPPVFKTPFFVIGIMLEKEVVLHGLVTLISFASLFCALTELPIALAMPPYSLSPALIGLCYVPGGIAGIMASPIGGRLSDRSAAAHPSEPMVRLLYNTIMIGTILPAALLLYAWAVHFKLNLALILVAQFFIGLSAAAFMPSVFGYLTAIKQQGAGAAASGIHSMMFIASGVLILVAAAAVQGMGFGQFFTLLAGLNILATVASLVQIWGKREKSRAVIRAASRVELKKGQVDSAAVIKDAQADSDSDLSSV